MAEFEDPFGLSTKIDQAHRYRLLKESTFFLYKKPTPTGELMKMVKVENGELDLQKIEYRE
jgi:hypothetical protein